MAASFRLINALIEESYENKFIIFHDAFHRCHDILPYFRVGEADACIKNK